MKSAAVPSPRYRTIVADPPWDIPWDIKRVEGKTPFGSWAGSLPYPTMNETEIASLPVADLSAIEAHLYLWTTTQRLLAAYRVAEAWGYEVMYPLAWCKPPKGRGLGGKFAPNLEFCLFCRDRTQASRVAAQIRAAAERIGATQQDVNSYMGVSHMAMWWFGRAGGGRARVPTWDQWLKLKELLPLDDLLDAEVKAVNVERNSTARCLTRWWIWPRTQHSQKPEAFLDIVESVSPGPYLEMFARRNRLGWDTWGAEALPHVELTA